MDYEKLYKDALERAKSLYNSMFVNNDILEQIFPELKKSENDIMIEVVKNIIAMADNGTLNEILKIYGKTKDDIISWLEKQSEQKSFARYKVGDTIYYDSFGRLVSFVIANIVEDGTDNPMYEDKDGNSVFQNDIVEQKSTDKVEPKFKIGDWVVYCGKTHQITGLNDDTFTITDCNGGYFFNKVESTHEPVFRLWTILDAKDGDILVTNNKPFIFKGLLDPKNPGCPVAYCGIGYGNYFIVGTGANGGTTLWSADKNVKPATKEQCDLLFTKMKEAGYKWYANKKKLIELNNSNEPNFSWHSVNEEPEEHREVFCEWDDDDMWHDVAFYYADTKTFWNDDQQIKDVIRWAYVDDVLESLKNGRKQLYKELSKPKYEN